MSIKSNIIKPILVCISIIGLLLLSACEAQSGAITSYASSQRRFAEIDSQSVRGYSLVIVYDTETGVEYVVRPESGVYPLYERDGSLKIYNN